MTVCFTSTLFCYMELQLSVNHIIFIIKSSATTSAIFEKDT